MFSMKEIGMRISGLRKAKNLTQMELADMLNISYQAVSNWERGETMPDISKLPEIATIFNVSIDNILNSKVTIINEIVKEKVVEEIDIKELKNVVPLLKPKQINSIVNKNLNKIAIDDLIEYIPFVDKQIADKIAKKYIENEIIALDKLLPFVSRECADDLIEKAIEMNCSEENLIKAIPFVNREVADKIVQKCVNISNKNLEEIIPFISSGMVEKILVKHIN